CQIEHAAIHQRQIAHLTFSDGLSDCASLCVQHRRLRGHLDLGGDCARLQRYVHSGDAGRINLYTFDQHFFETAALHLNPVENWIQIRDAISASWRGRDLYCTAGADVGNGYGSSGNNCSMGIKCCPTNTAGITLSTGQVREDERDKKRSECSSEVFHRAL